MDTGQTIEKSKTVLLAFQKTVSTTLRSLVHLLYVYCACRVCRITTLKIIYQRLMVVMSRNHGKELSAEVRSF